MSPSTAWTIAHRGASKDRPENTRVAFDEALHQGCDGIELDLQLSRDGVPVVYHDRTLLRAGGGRRRVSQLPWAELRELDPACRWSGRFPDQRIPTLEEVLESYAPRTRLLVEIKTGRATPGHERELARRTARMIREARGFGEVLILCFHADLLRECASIAPEVPRVLNLKPPSRLLGKLRDHIGDFQALSADVRTLTPEFGADVRQAGVPLYVFTCNTPRRVTRALGAGAQGVMSDKPGWLADRIREHASP